MRRIIGALTFALAVAATTVIAQQPQPPEVALFTKAGWWVRVDTQKTEASSVTLQIGTRAGDRRAWRAWHSGEVQEFDVPRDFQSVKELYIQASSNPSGKTTRFCVFYQGLGMKRFDFSGDKDEQIKQSDRDGACQ
jgi:hypothetical protein